MTKLELITSELLGHLEKLSKEAVEELADILELLHAAVKIHGSSIEELEQIRQAKAEKRGGFDKRIFLIEVEDD